MRQTLRSGGGEAAAGELPRIASGRSTHRRPYEDAEQPRTKLGHAEQTRALELDHRRPTGLAPTPAQSFHVIAPPIHEAETGPRVRSLDEGHKSNPVIIGQRRWPLDCFASLAMTRRVGLIERRCKPPRPPTMTPNATGGRAESNAGGRLPFSTSSSPGSTLLLDALRGDSSGWRAGHLHETPSDVVEESQEREVVTPLRPVVRAARATRAERLDHVIADP